MFASCDRKEEPSIDSHVVGFMSCSLHVASQALSLSSSQCANASAVVDLLFFGGCCASAGKELVAAHEQAVEYWTQETDDGRVQESQ